ncbi:LysE family translocator [Variovorax sp. HJSM1_2]|uniref:LysE family translocator n=1 Tax=Variovorax sp. HJSM1_2 TaxID=3366263 RepID=UPI003BE2C92B
MPELAALLGIIAALSVGTISPGPSFVMVARTAVSASRAEALAAALGMGLGGVLFAVLALLGLQGVLLAVPSLYLVLKLAGGLYLAYLGWRIWLSATQPLVITSAASGDTNTGPSNSLGRALTLGLTTQISNPKTAIVYASVFAAFMPAVHSLGFSLAVAACVLVIEAGWYAVVATALSSHGPRNTYLRYKSWLDRMAGGVMIALGLKLVASARS